MLDLMRDLDKARTSAARTRQQQLTHSGGQKCERYLVEDKTGGHYRWLHEAQIYMGDLNLCLILDQWKEHQITQILKKLMIV